MREIKFRGKRIDNGEWVHGYYEWLRTPLIHWMEEYGMGGMLCLAQVDPETVGQYTGFKDKGGVEIYEGDILKCVDIDGEEYTTAVSFDGGAFAVDSTGCDYDYTAIGWAMEVDVDECWVIGNLHDPRNC